MSVFHNKNRHRQNGVVLVLVLVILLALAAMVMNSMEGTLTGVGESGSLRPEYEARLKAEACISIIQKRLKKDNLDTCDSYKEPWSDTWEEEGVKIVIRPCNSRINLNSFDQEDKDKQKRFGKAIASLLPAKDMDPNMVLYLLDWLDGDQKNRYPGSEGLAYSKKLPGYTPRNDYLLRPEELLLVKGWKVMGPKFVRDNFTIWGNSKLNLNFVPMRILEAYVPELAPYISEIQDWRDAYTFEHVTELLKATPLSAENEDYNEALNFVTVQSNYFEAMVTVSVPGVTLVKRYILKRDASALDEAAEVICQDDISISLENY